MQQQQQQQPMCSESLCKYLTEVDSDSRSPSVYVPTYATQVSSVLDVVWASKDKPDMVPKKCNVRASKTCHIVKSSLFISRLLIPVERVGQTKLLPGPFLSFPLPTTPPMTPGFRIPGSSFSYPSAAAAGSAAEIRQAPPCPH